MALALRTIHSLSNWLDRVSGVSSLFCLVAMVLLTGLQIICRMYFTALPWSEELARYLLVLSTFLGAGCVYKRAGHISVTALRALCPPALHRALALLSHALCAAFFFASAYYGVKYMGLQARQVSAAMRIPMSWIYLAIPVGCGIMALHALDALAGNIFGRLQAKASRGARP